MSVPSINNNDPKKMLYPLNKNERLTNKEMEIFKQFCPTLARIGIVLKHDICEDNSPMVSQGRAVYVGNSAILKTFDCEAEAILDNTEQEEQNERIQQLKNIILQKIEPETRFLELLLLRADIQRASQEEEKGYCAIL